MIKDKFTRAELGEFTVGILFTLFLSYRTIVAITEEIPTETSVFHGIFLLVITLSACVTLLWLRRTEKIWLRIIIALLMALAIVPIYYYCVFGIFIVYNLEVYLISVSASVVGALTIDILKED